MARPTTWNEPELLGSVMALFRRRGFRHTSVRDIGEATGLHPGSLYKAYGSKDGLFVSALRAYNERVVADRVRNHLESAADPLAGIRALFTSTFDGDDADNPGCLLTNTAIESQAIEPKARKAVAAGFAVLERGFETTLERARERGQIPRTARLDEIAAQLLAFYQGVLVLVRFGMPTAKLATITDRTLNAIVGSTKPPRKRRKRR